MSSYYKHPDGSVAKANITTQFGKQVLDFRAVVPDHSLYGRRFKLDTLGVDNYHFFVRIQDTYLVKAGGRIYYLHDYPANDPRAMDDKPSDPHLYLFQPTEDEKVMIEIDIRVWEQREDRLARERAG